MKKLALLSLILLLMPIAAAQISSYEIEATVYYDTVKEQVLIFADYRGETSAELRLPPNVKNLEVSINDRAISCTQKEILGATEIICPITAKTDYFLKLNFETTFPIISLDDKELFNQRLSLNKSVDKFVFRLNLPERAVLSEPVEKFVTPEPTKIYSDGRHIILLYEILNMKDFEVSVIYEPPAKSPVLMYSLVIFSVLILIGFVVFKYSKKKGPIAEIKSEEKKREQPKEELYLLPDEKGIVYILKQAGKPIRQRDIEKQITFSKAKLSRVLRGLAERGIVKIIPRGNTNLIDLIKG